MVVNWDESFSQEPRLSFTTSKNMLTHPKYTWDVFFRGMNDVGITNTGHHEVIVPHVEDLRHVDWRKSVPIRADVVEEQFEVTYDNKLPDPTLLHASRLGHFDVTFVGCSNTTSRVDSKRPLCWNPISQIKVARKEYYYRGPNWTQTKLFENGHSQKLKSSRTQELRSEQMSRTVTN